MKKISLFLFLVWSLSSCDNDIERKLSTDLQIEGTGIFNVSTVYEESLYFLMLTIEDYRLAHQDSIELPGCPEISINTELNEVVLTFTSNTDCSSQKLKRSGSLKINFTRTNTFESRRILSYENYKVKDLAIQGTRTVLSSRGGLPNSFVETFEQIRITNPRGSSSRISGNITHQLQLINRQLTGFTSSGQLTGINTAGRTLTMQSISPRRYTIECLKEGYHIAPQGVERWSVSRGESNSPVIHTLNFELVDTCQSRVSMSLSDGRVLIFNE